VNEPRWSALVSILLVAGAVLAQRLYLQVDTGNDEPAAQTILPILIALVAATTVVISRGRYLKMLLGREFLLIWGLYFGLSVILPILGVAIGHYGFRSLYSLITPALAVSALILGATLQAIGWRGLSSLARPILIAAVAQAAYAVIQQLLVAHVLPGGPWDLLLQWDAATQGAFGRGLVFGRSSGFYVNPNILGVWAGLAMLAGLAIVEGRSRYVLVGAALTTLLLSQSRGSAIALAAGLAVLLILARRRGTVPSLRTLAPYGLVALVVILGWAFLASLGTPAGSLVGRLGQGIGVLGGGSDPSVTGRLEFWGSSLHLLLAHPFGTLGPPETLLGSAVDSEWIRAALQGGPVYVMGLGLALIGGAAAYVYDSPERRAVRACCVFLAVAGLSQLPLEYPPVYLFWALLGGVLIQRPVRGAVRMTGRFRQGRASVAT